MFKEAHIIKKYEYEQYTDYHINIDGDDFYIYRTAPQRTSLFTVYSMRATTTKEYRCFINVYIPMNEDDPLKTVNRLIKLQLLI